MNKYSRAMKLFIIITAAHFCFSSCSQRAIDYLPDNPEIIPEYKVDEILLADKAGERYIEASGLAWFGDLLIILPQYPHKVSNRFDGALLALKKQQILDYVNGVNTTPLKAREIPFIAKGLDSIGKAEGSGYEAITFSGSSVYLSIESFDSQTISSFIVEGKVFGDIDSIVINADSKRSIISNSKLKNMGEETIVCYKDNLYCIHEANGKNAVPHPVVNKINLITGEVERQNFPIIEYRITDATQPDSAGNFWAFNYLYSGDIKKLNPAMDSLVIKNGIGRTNNKFQGIERIVKFRITDNGISLAKLEPVYLQLTLNEERNWEGLVKLDDLGFLIISDYYPATILGYVRGSFN